MPPVGDSLTPQPQPLGWRTVRPPSPPSPSSPPLPPLPPLPPSPLVTLPPPLASPPTPPPPPPPAPDADSHTPPLQAPPLQGVPSGSTGFVQAPLDLSHVPARWHSSIAVHINALPPQTPAVHASLSVHGLASSHAAPSAFIGYEHTPLTGLHAPKSWHASGGGQTTGAPALQTPAWHVSPCEHAFLSSHAAPSFFEGFEHAPVLGLHTPRSWQESRGAHITGLAPTHTPSWHVSTMLHALLSLHAVPSAFAGFEHIPVAPSQVPAIWQVSSGMHITGAPPVHTPAWQVSLWVHALLSLHADPLTFIGVEHMPVAGLQTPWVWH